MKESRQVRGRKNFHWDFCPVSQRRTGFTLSVKTEHMPVTQMFGSQAVFLHCFIGNVQGERGLTLYKRHPSTTRLEGRCWCRLTAVHEKARRQISNNTNARHLEWDKWTLEHWCLDGFPDCSPLCGTAQQQQRLLQHQPQHDTDSKRMRDASHGEVQGRASPASCAIGSGFYLNLLRKKQGEVTQRWHMFSDHRLQSAVSLQKGKQACCNLIWKCGGWKH